MTYEIKLRVFVDADSFEAADAQAREMIRELADDWMLSVRNVASGELQMLTAEAASARKKANDG